MITLQGGNVQNISSIAVPNGSISFQLNIDGGVIASPYGLIPADQVTTFQFDSAGNLVGDCQIYSNVELNPQNSLGLGTWYLVTVYNANGARLNKNPWSFQFTQASGSTVDIGQMVPFKVGGNVIFYTTPLPNVLLNPGDLLYENPQRIPARLPVGTEGQVLIVAGGLPAWGADLTATTALQTANSALQAAANNTYQGAWNAETSYVTNNEVSYNGGFYVAMTDNVNAEPDISPVDWHQISSPSNAEFLGAWNNATAYVIGNQVTLNQNYYICIAPNTNAEPDTHPLDWQQIASSETYLGAYNNGTAYVPGNEVSFNGSFYICISATTGNLPGPQSSFWTLLGTSSSFLGAWSSTAPYVVGNEVTFQGGYFNCIVANTNESPVGPNGTTYWQSITIPVDASNLVQNSTFVAGLAGWGDTISLVSDTLPNGATGNVLALTAANFNNAIFSNSFPLTPGQTYYLSGWIKTGGAGDWDLYWGNYGDAFLSDLAAPTAWTYFSAKYTVPTNATELVGQFAITNASVTSDTLKLWNPSYVLASPSEYLGAWSSLVEYQPGNQVTFDQNYYICLAENINEVPTNTAFWQKISSAETYLGAYSGSTAYVPGNEVSFNGAYYICISATTGNAPSTTSSFWTLLGTSAILIGAWSNSTAYIPGNEVTYQGNYYVCIQANTNKQPDLNPNYWTQVTTSTAFTGTWSNLESYFQGNLVLYNGNEWVCDVANTNQPPSLTSAFWTLCATTPSGIGFLTAGGGGNICFNGNFLTFNATPVPTNFGVYNNGGIPVTAAINVGGGAVGNVNSWSITAGANVTNTFGFYFLSTAQWGGWQPNADYIVSFYAKLSANPNSSVMGDDWNDAPATRNWMQNPVLSTEWQLYVFQFNFGTNTIDPNGYFSINQAVPNGTTLAFSNVVVQQGTIPSGWSTPNYTPFFGAWSSTANYVPGDQVTYQPSGGSINYYVALQTNTNAAPDANPSDWYRLVNNTAITAGSTYRPTTNPLSAIDAGSNATIDIASFDMNVAGVGLVSINSGSITGLSYSTLYFIYYADPNIAGGSVTFLDTTTKTDSISSGVNFYIGSILTPAKGGPETFGNNDGGTGNQNGNTVTVWPTISSPVATSVCAACINNYATAPPSNGYTLVNGAQLVLSGFSSLILPACQGYVLIVDWQSSDGATITVTNPSETHTESSSFSRKLTQISLGQQLNPGLTTVTITDADSGGTNDTTLYGVYIIEQF